VTRRRVGPALVVRVGAGAVGVGIMAVAVWGIVRDRGYTNPVGLAIWLGGGVALHDFVLAPLVLLAGAVVVRVVPGTARGPVVVGLVTAGTLILVGAAVILGSRRTVANPTVLPGSYPAALLGALAVVASATTAVVMVRRWRRGRTGRVRLRRPEPD